MVTAEGAPWDGAKGALKSYLSGRGDLLDKKTVGEYAGDSKEAYKGSGHRQQRQAKEAIGRAVGWNVWGTMVHTARGGP